MPSRRVIIEEDHALVPSEMPNSFSDAIMEEDSTLRMVAFLILVKRYSLSIIKLAPSLA